MVILFQTFIILYCTVLWTAIEDDQEQETKQRYQSILQRKNLVDLTKAQDVEIAMLSSELERMRMKTFPALPQ